jgi:ectoine hydroxylase-related dioxygenase (phytanoyl-CoA dioxygenase family)
VLPHSQKFTGGYVASYRADVAARFESSFVQLPLSIGDALFFNPALLHAAGSNVTPTVRRIGNLLQISSAFGRAMESVDRTRVALAVYDQLGQRVRAGLPVEALAPAIAAAAEGYAFPTNLDRDPPVDGLAPASPAEIVGRALEERWDRARLAGVLHEGETRRQAHPLTDFSS